MGVLPSGHGKRFQWGWVIILAVSCNLKPENVPVGDHLLPVLALLRRRLYVPQPVLAADTMLNRGIPATLFEQSQVKREIDGGFSFEKVTRPFYYTMRLFTHCDISVSEVFAGTRAKPTEKNASPYTKFTQALIQAGGRLLSKTICLSIMYRQRLISWKRKILRWLIMHFFAKRRKRYPR